MMALLLLLGGPLLLSAASAADAPACHIFPGATYGMGQIATGAAADAGECCAQCTASPLCQAWTFHKKPSAADPEKNCYLKDNVKPESPPRKIDPHNNTLSGLTAGPTCTPHASVCASGEPCPVCGAPICSCTSKGPVRESPFGCLPPHDTLPFCDRTLSVHERVLDLVGRINATDKPNLMTARGKGGNGQHMQSLPALGVPAYYWGTNCLHSLNGGQCVVDSHNKTRCPVRPHSPCAHPSPSQQPRFPVQL